MGRPCSEKISYRSKHTAKRRLAFLRTRRTVSAENRRRLNVYRCQECGMYHIGKHGMTKQRRHPKPELDLAALVIDLRALGYEATDPDGTWERDDGYSERAISATREDDRLNIAFQAVLFFDGGGLIETADPVRDWPAIEAIGRRLREAGILPAVEPVKSSLQQRIDDFIDQASRQTPHEKQRHVAPDLREDMDAQADIMVNGDGLTKSAVNTKVRYEPTKRRRGTGGRRATKRRK